MVNGGDSKEVYALRNLHDTITTVHGVQDLEEVLQRTAQGVVEVLGFQVAAVDCVDPHGYVEALAVAGDEDACRALKGRRVLLSEILDEFELADEWGSLRFVPHDRLPPDAVSTWVPDLEPLDAADAWHPLDALYAPLHGPRGDLLGVLQVDLPEDGRRPGVLSRQILEMYAVQAGLAIHHAQERGRLEERIRLAGATRTIVETASRELDLGHILNASFQPLADGFRCAGLLIRVLGADDLDAEGFDGVGAMYPRGLADHLKARLSECSDDPEADHVLPLQSLGERVARTCWERATTCVVARGDVPSRERDGDSGEDLLSPEDRESVEHLLEVLAASSLMILPFGAGPECLGYIALVRAQIGARWTPAESEAAVEVGREIGRAVERARLYQGERRLVAELQELDRLKSEMIATVTHELKNPLTSIYGHVELLRESGAPRASVEAIERNVERLQGMVDDMLLLAKIKDPNRTFAPVPVPLGELVMDTCDLLEVQAAQRSQTLEVAPVHDGVQVDGEHDDLARLITNLVSNAIRYTPEGGTVTLEVCREDGEAVFRCMDTGIGIADSDLDTLFEEFDRSSNPQAYQVPGSGLGLAIVRRIVQRHGGRIEVQSELGRGSVFTVRLPLSESPASSGRSDPGRRGSTRSRVDGPGGGLRQPARVG